MGVGGQGGIPLAGGLKTAPPADRIVYVLLTPPLGLSHTKFADFLLTY